MLKAAALNARCLSTSLQKSSHIHSSSRLLHNSNDVSRPPRIGDDDAVIPPTKKKPRIRPDPRQPKQSSSATRAETKEEKHLSWSDIIPMSPSKSRSIERMPDDSKCLDDSVQHMTTTRHEGKKGSGKGRQGKEARPASKLGSGKALLPGELSAHIKELGTRGQFEEAFGLLQEYTASREEKKEGTRWKARQDGQPEFLSKLGAERAIRPVVQSARVKELSERGQLEEAITYVYDAPRDTLNTITWNQLIAVLMKAGRRKRAYDVYIEMKRRGFIPDISTYITMLRGMSEISRDEWPANQENLTRTHKIYEAFEAHVALCEERGLFGDLTFAHYARMLYSRAVTKAGLFQRAIDIFYSAPEIGPLARDKFLYSVIFIGLKWRTTTDKLGNLSAQEQNASDAKFIWRTLEKDVERGLEIDSHIIFPFLKLMVDGRPADRLFGLEVVRDYCGLAAPGETAPPARAPLTSFTLLATLELCNKAQKYRLCSYFVKQLLDQQRAGTSNPSDLIIHSSHIHEFIIALRHLAVEGSVDESNRAVEAIRFLLRSAALESTKTLTEVENLPREWKIRKHTISFAFAICWRCRDWESATKIFSLVTQHSADDYLDGGPVANGNTEPKSSPLINLSSYSHMARTALLTETKEKMRQFLRMISIEHIKGDPYETHSNFYLVKLAKAVIKLVGATSGGASKREKRKFAELVTKSEEILSQPLKIEQPKYEETLGSAKYIDKLEQAIEFELSARKSS